VRKEWTNIHVEHRNAKTQMETGKENQTEKAEKAEISQKIANN